MNSGSTDVVFCYKYVKPPFSNFMGVSKGIRWGFRAVFKKVSRIFKKCFKAYQDFSGGFRRAPVFMRFRGDLGSFRRFSMEFHGVSRGQRIGAVFRGVAKHFKAFRVISGTWKQFPEVEK